MVVLGFSGNPSSMPGRQPLPPPGTIAPARRNGKWVKLWPAHLVNPGDDDVIIKESALKAAKDLGLNRGNISAVCNGKKPTVGGYKAAWCDPPEPQDNLPALTGQADKKNNRDAEVWKQASDRLFVSNRGRAQLKNARGNGWGYKFTPQILDDREYATIAFLGKDHQFHIVVYTTWYN